MGGRVIAGDGGATWSGATLDSRRVRGGELFFALPGERTDGHRFVADALERGAAAAVVERPVEVPRGGLVRVDDALTGLHALTASLRGELPARVVGITGSVGKTTTKELAAAVLARRWRVARNPGNLNNLLGFPVAFLGIDEATEWMVAEMGMSEPGELSRISRLGRPDVAVLLNVRPVHLEFFGELRAISRAKAEILDGLAPGGRVVAHRDDPEVRWIVRRRGVEPLWFGRGPESEVRASEVVPAGAAGSRFRLTTPAGEVDVSLPLVGGHNVDNALAAAAVGHLLGVGPEEIASALAGAAPLEHRGVLHVLPGGGSLLDDSYNANPDAVERALAAASSLGGRRRWAVLGDMLELGDEAPALHRRVGRRAAEGGFAPVIGVGELARELVAAARRAGAEARWLPDAEAAARAAVEELAAGDVVLVKGSRGVGLEVVVEALLAAGGAGVGGDVGEGG